jgi:hypothetical protein
MFSLDLSVPCDLGDDSRLVLDEMAHWSTFFLMNIVDGIALCFAIGASEWLHSLYETMVQHDGINAY